MNTNTPTPPEKLLSFLNRYTRFFILGHSEPDGDCLGSQLSISILLDKLGAENHLYSPGPFRRPEIQEYAPLFSTRIPGTLTADARQKGDTAVLIMDCSTMERIGEKLRSDIEGLPLGVIDHHASGEQFGEVRWIEPSASSVTLMVHHIYKALNLNIEIKEAVFLFLGLCTDTGYFRHLEEGSETTFSMAADLVKAGVNPKRIFHKMNGNRSLPSRILLGTLLARTESHLNDRILVTWETLEEKKRFGPENRDSDLLYLQLQNIKNCQAVILVREETETECSVGLRSNNTIDVGALAARMGGGGHPRAAGFYSSKSRREIILELLDILTDQLL